MARPTKDGLEYFPLDVGFFEDDKIYLLQSEHGAIGVMVWIRLLCLIYKDNGYFYRWDATKAKLLARRIGGECTPGKVELIVASCVKWSLFDRKLFDVGNVLSSRGIQRRYMHAIKERARKAAAEGRQITVDAGVWLLDEEELVKGLVLVGPEGIIPGKNGDYSAEKPELILGRTPKVKESKEKERKAKERRGGPAAPKAAPTPSFCYGELGLVKMTKEEHAKLTARFGEAAVASKITHMELYMRGKGASYADHYATLMDWLNQDAAKTANAAGPAAPVGKRTSAHQFSQREYTDEELNYLYDDLEELARGDAQ